MPVTEKDYEYLKEKFSQLKDYVELRDFRTFFLFNLIDESESMIQRLMEGGRSIRTFLYDSRGAWIYEYPFTKGRLLFYSKESGLNELSVLDREKNKEFFDKYLKKFEQKELLSPQEDKMGIVKLSSKMIEADIQHKIVPKFEITRIYEDFLSFLFDIGKSRYVFVLDGGKNEPNIVFAVSILLSNALNQEYIAIQAYIDKDKKYTGQFLRVNSEKFIYESVDEIDEAGHKDIHTNFLLLVHIKSFKSI